MTGSPDRSADAGGEEARSDAEGLEEETDAAGIDADPSATCEGAHEDLGVLATDEPTVISRTLEALEGALTSCNSAGEAAGEYTFAFQVEEAAILETSISAPTTDSLSFALYGQGCGDEAEIFCTQRSPWRAMVEPNKKYFLKVQAGESTEGNTFNTTFSFDEAVCTPNETTCSDGTSNRCIQGTSVEPYSCAGECTDGQSCAGDLCQAALTVEPAVGGDAVVIEGERWAYTHQWNAADLSGCETSTPIEIGQTTAMELFVRMPNLEAGQTVEIRKGDDSGSYLYFVLDECGAQSCREAMFVDEAGDNQLVWDVPEDGSYIIVIEALSSTSRSFRFEAAVR